MPWGEPTAMVSWLALAASCGVLWITFLQHRHARRTGYIGELRGELDLLHSKLEAADTRADAQGAVIVHQREEIADLTVREAACRAENERLDGRVTQLEGEVRQLNQLVDSARVTRAAPG